VAEMNTGRRGRGEILENRQAMSKVAQRLTPKADHSPRLPDTYSIGTAELTSLLRHELDNSKTILVGVGMFYHG
jgi:hypothetical protein